MTATAPSFPMPRSHPLDPPSQYEELRKSGVMSRVTLWNGQSVWLVSRYDEVKALLGDPRLSASPDSPGYPNVSGGVAANARQETTFLRMDPPEHNAQRRTVQKYFTIKYVAAMRQPIEDIVVRLIDEMIEHGPVLDFVKHFALPLPTSVITLLLGTPYEDHDFIQTRTSARISYSLTPEEAVRADRELMDYLDRLVTAKETEPGDDLISGLILDYGRSGELTHAQITALGRLLISAGHETTASMLSMGLLTLLLNPEQCAIVRADRSTVPSAVEELLRYLTVIPLSTRRAALEDIQVSGQTIKAGEGVFLLTSSANRDESQFPEPDRVDVRRDARRHLAFGYGVHQCLGQALARLELQVAFDAILHRMPPLTLAASLEDLSFTADSVSYGLRSLPISW